MFWHEPLVHLLVIAVLAALATIMLFKWLGSQAFVKKEEKGLQVMLTGAAAGFALIGAGLYYVDRQLVNALPQETPREAGSSLLTLRGKINFPAGTPINRDLLFTFEPPIQTVMEDGRFLIEGIPFFKSQKTRIHAIKDGVKFCTIVLDDNQIVHDTAQDDSCAYVLRSDLVYRGPAVSDQPSTPEEAYNPEDAGKATKVGP